MSKIKKIKLTIHSHIDNADSHPEINDSEYEAYMKICGKEIGLSYEERSEGGTLFSDILLRDGRVTVSRRGAIRSTLVFEEGKTYGSIYEIPPYKFDMNIKTKKLKIALNECGGVIDILYDMDLGGAIKKARMKISAEEVKSV